mgnify:CR=1 FL=1
MTGKKSKRLQLDMPPESLERLEELKKSSEATTYAEVCRRALRLYSTLVRIEKEDGEVRPSVNYEYGMYMNKQWYRLKADASITNVTDPVKKLDISILSDYVIDPILGIADQRTSMRIDFVGGIRGLGELVKRVDSGEMKVAFAIHPVEIDQLIDVADSGNVMPPKTTWFEPKLRSALTIYEL